MVTFSYIEDYIQFIAGTRSLTNQVTVIWLATPAVNLARYDKSVVNSFAEQIASSTPFTDKQAELARRIAKNYRRQMYRLGVQIPEDVDSLPFKMPLRKVDRSKRMYIKDGKLCVKFPFNTDFINLLKDFARTSDGEVSWHQDNKVWQFALTESCVNWACAFGSATSFEISPELANMAASIIDCENQPYRIELVKTDTGFTITNAPTTLVNYIEEHGGFGLDNESALLDMAAELGYTLSEDLVSTVQYPELLKSKTVHVSSETNDISVIVDYARAYNRFPILSLNTPQTTLDKLSTYFQDDEIIYLAPSSDKIKNQDIVNDNTKLVHVNTNSIKEWQGTMPLVIAYTNMTFGTVKSILLRDAGKVCYYTAYDITYNERT